MAERASRVRTSARKRKIDGLFHVPLAGGDVGVPVQVSVAAAESCTGGLVASRFVSIPGSGDWFVGGVRA